MRSSSFRRFGPACPKSCTGVTTPACPLFLGEAALGQRFQSRSFLTPPVLLQSPPLHLCPLRCSSGPVHVGSSEAVPVSPACCHPPSPPGSHPHFLTRRPTCLWPWPLRCGFCTTQPRSHSFAVEICLCPPPCSRLPRCPPALGRDAPTPMPLTCSPSPAWPPCIPSFTSLPAFVPAAGRLSPALPESTAPPRGPPRGSPPRSSTSAQALCLLDAARSSLAQQAHPGRPEQGVPAPRHCGISQLPSLAPRTAVEGVCWALAFPGSLTVGRTHTALLMPADCPRPRGAWVSSGHLGLCNQRAGAWSCSHEQQPQVCYYGDGACGPGWFLVVPVGCLRWQW